MGEKKRTIVEINGRRYDAVTGSIIEKTPTANKVIDGFTSPVQGIAKPPAKPQQQVSSSRNVTSSNSIHAKPQKTKKLHPAAAAKTTTQNSVAAKSQPTHSEGVNLTNMASVPRAASYANTGRAERAATHAKNPLVQKFSSHPDIAVTPLEQINTQPEVPALKTTMPRHQTVAPKPVKQTAVSQVVEKDTEEPSKKKRSLKPKLLPVSIMAFALLAIGGYITYSNIPNMALRVASQRAGFSASLPGYKPAGFSFGGPVAYTDGTIELGYTSNSDDRSFVVVQKKSTWDSKSLLDNYVRKQSEDYLTFQERGLTIYVYDQSNAAWVDGGIWYTIEGDSLLTSEQLLKIAGSL